MEKIQRVPRGLNDLLSISGGATPTLLDGNVQTTLDLLQFYGLNQVQQKQAANAALAEGGTLQLTVPLTEHWLLYQAGFSVAKTSTMTAAQLSLQLGPPQAVVGYFNSGSLAPFGATETGTLIFGSILPYPRLLLPGWVVLVRLDVLGTDATANVTISALVGVLG